MHIEGYLGLSSRRQAAVYALDGKAVWGVR